MLYRVQYLINNKNLEEVEKTFGQIDKLLDIIIKFVFTNQDKNIIPTFPFKNSLIYLIYDFVLKSYGYYKLGNLKLAHYYLNQIYEINKKYAEIIPSATPFCDVIYLFIIIINDIFILIIMLILYYYIIIYIFYYCTKIPINDQKVDHIDVSFISEHQLYAYILFLTRKLKFNPESKEVVKYLEKEISNVQCNIILVHFYLYK